MGSFGEVEDPSQGAFDQKLALYLAMNDVMYVFEVQTNKGRIPVGVLTGKIMGPVLWLGDAIWFPWTSSRNKYESMVNMFNEIRRKYVALFTCTMKDRDFYDAVARHGVIRRVGTLYDITDDKLAHWQTRKPGA